MSNQKETAYKYVWVGGGMVSGYAVKGIREKDKDGSILIVSKETDVPYERPSLTKKLWIDDEFTEEEIKIGAESYPNVSFKLATEVTKVTPKDKTIELEDKSIVSYQQLLLATGGEPKTIDEDEEASHVIVFRDWSDYRNYVNLVGKINM